MISKFTVLDIRWFPISLVKFSEKNNNKENIVFRYRSAFIIWHFEVWTNDIFKYLLHDGTLLWYNN